MSDPVFYRSMDTTVKKSAGLGKKIKKERREGKEISSFIYFKISSVIKGREISRYDVR